MDTDSTNADTALWKQTMHRVRRELAELPADQRSWLTVQVEQIGALQRELDRLFRAIDGQKICTDCLGGCCSRAKHHLTLTNVLASLLVGEEPPPPDFALPCPLLGPHGCRLPVEQRPFNCIIFLCDPLDRELTETQREVFARAETALRNSYEAIAGRCPGASLRGLLIAAERCGDRPLLTNSAPVSP